MNNEFKFSICTLVSRLDQYIQLRASLTEGGFNNSNSEFHVIDNSESNQMDAYEGIRFFIRNSKNDLIIIVHQDVSFAQNSYKRLCFIINDITKKDPHWAVLSNAGKSCHSLKAYASFGDGIDTWHTQPLPQMVQSVDEHFIVLKKSTGVTVSRDLDGFHFYGTELCQVANRLGYTCYVIDFYLVHFSHGNMDDSFYKSKIRIEKKYAKLQKIKRIPTMCTNICVSSRFLNKIISDACSYLILLNSKHHLKSMELLKSDPNYCLLISRIVMKLRLLNLIFSTRNNYIKIRSDLGWWRKNWRSRVGL